MGKLASRKAETRLLVGSWEDLDGRLIYPEGEAPTKCMQNWELIAVSDEEGRLSFRLQRFEIVGQSVPLPSGDSGVISLFGDPRDLEKVDMVYDPEDGSLEAMFTVFFHCKLIDDIVGHQPWGEEEYPDHFRPYLFGGVGRLTGRFEGPLELHEGAEVPFAGEFHFDSRDDLGDIELWTLRELLPRPLVSSFAVTWQPRGLRAPEGPTVWPPWAPCMYDWPMRRLTIQPVFVDAGNGIKSGEKFAPMMRRAQYIWMKCCIEFEVLPPKYVNRPSYYVLDSKNEADQFVAEQDADGKAIRVFVASQWNVNEPKKPEDPTPTSVFDGGGYCVDGGTGEAYIVTVDSQIAIPKKGAGACRNHASGPVNMNHLAHELGHVLGLDHPEALSRRASPETVMEGSGYCADNPDKQSRNNCALIRNSILKPVGRCCGYPEIHDEVRRSEPSEFHLAPPAKGVDGLLAVPVNILRVKAKLTFDGGTFSGKGDATIRFLMGPEGGCPIFDLRQTVTEVWLNGNSIPVSKIARHDFGGGPNAGLLVLDAVLPAETEHTLRLVYDLGPPQAPKGGAYPPGMTWDQRYRCLHFNFGFTDQEPGRYLESWIPANLIFDPFELLLEVQVVNAPFRHSLVTNGLVTAQGAGRAVDHWHIKFPDHFTALSPMLEVHPEVWDPDLWLSWVLNSSIKLPISKRQLDIAVWEPQGNVATRLTHLKDIEGWLADNEKSVGPYPHSRFIALLNVGGMAYEGGVTCKPTRTALWHEVFHSWWGRGVKPARHADIWWSEGWTGYNSPSRRPKSVAPFNFRDKPVELCSRNPWVRATPSAARTAGTRFFDGVASLAGTANLDSLMREFYSEHTLKPTTTRELEAFLIHRIGKAQLVDAFHRFVYGFDDPSPAPRLSLHDPTAPIVHGPTSWPAGSAQIQHWDSPDLWVRNDDDGDTIHQPPEAGQDNWIYARVYNASTGGTARHFVVVFNVKTVRRMTFRYPEDFLPGIAAAVEFDLKPGESRIVKGRWPAPHVPQSGTHPTVLAAVIARSDHPAIGAGASQHGNLAQKSLTVVDLMAHDSAVVPFMVSTFDALSSSHFMLELVRPVDHEQLEASVLYATDMGTPSEHGNPGGERISEVDCGAGMLEELAVEDWDMMWTSQTPNARGSRWFEEAEEEVFAPGRTSQIPVVMEPQGQWLLGLKLRAPQDAEPGEVIRVDLVQRDDQDGDILGGLAVEMHVK
jgi:hypothetical protein